MNNLPDEYFMSVDDDMLAYLEKQGEECIRDLQRSNDVNKDNAQKLLSILIVGIGSAFLLLTQHQNSFYVFAGVCAFTIYWSLCAAYLVYKVMFGRIRKLNSASPQDLYSDYYKTINDRDYEELSNQHGYEGSRNALSVLRRSRLVNMSEIVDELSAENSRISTSLNLVRLASILTPLCALAISTIAYLFC